MASGGSILRRYRQSCQFCSRRIDFELEGVRTLFGYHPVCLSCADKWEDRYANFTPGTTNVARLTGVTCLRIDSVGMSYRGVVGDVVLSTDSISFLGRSYQEWFSLTDDPKSRPNCVAESEGSDKSLSLDRCLGLIERRHIDRIEMEYFEWSFFRGVERVEVRVFVRVRDEPPNEQKVSIFSRTKTQEAAARKSKDPENAPRRDVKRIYDDMQRVVVGYPKD